jgi:hypothetical protein
MDQRLQKYFDLLETDRKILLNQLSSLTDDQRNISFNGKWSINQILTHLLTAERLSLVYMKKKYLGVEQLTDTGMLEAFKMVLLKISQRVPVIRYKAPKVLLTSTPAAVPFKEIVSKWDAFREDLKKFLDTIPSHHARKKIYKHHIAGRLDAAQGVAFLREHFHHHMPQIRRLVNVALTR